MIRLPAKRRTHFAKPVPHEFSPCSVSLALVGNRMEAARGLAEKPRVGYNDSGIET
jgi:hypothetical protein